MAGRGTRLRPHTLTKPKPLLKICNKSIIEWIIGEISVSISSKIDEIHFIVGDFGSEVEMMLLKIAEEVGAKGYIHYQLQALGTAHALYCAKVALEGNVFIAFADTIFKGRIVLDTDADGIIWTMEVDNPEKYGVVNTDNNSFITEFIEKPAKFVSNKAIVGLYYFKNAEVLRREVEYLVDNDLKENNEYQLTNCLESLKSSGEKLKCQLLKEWLDCGNHLELLNTNKRLLEINTTGRQLINQKAVIKSSEIGDYVSIDDDVVIENSVLKNCIVYRGATIINSIIHNSIIGEYARIENAEGKFFLGDYSTYAKD